MVGRVKANILRPLLTSLFRLWDSFCVKKLQKWQNDLIGLEAAPGGPKRSEEGGGRFLLGTHRSWSELKKFNCRN